MSGLPGNCTVPKDFQQVLNRVQKGMLERGIGVFPQQQQEVAPQQQPRDVAPQQQRGGGPGRGERAYGKDGRDETFRSFQAIPGSELVGDQLEWGADNEFHPTGRQDAVVPAKGGATPGPRSGVFTGTGQHSPPRMCATIPPTVPRVSVSSRGTLRAIGLT